MEIGVLDLASRIVAKRADGATLHDRAARARSAFYAAGARASLCAAQREAAQVSGEPDFGIPEGLRQSAADQLPAALAAIFDLADIVGADVGSLARAAVAAAGDGGASRLRDDTPAPAADVVTDSPLTDPREPAFVDGHPWTKRDEIAQALFIAGCSARTALERADDLLRVRKEALDASRGAES